MKHPKLLLSVPALLAAAVLSPGIAHADFVLDTGTPPGDLGSAELNSGSLIAAEFVATAGDTLTTVSAYLTAGGDPSPTSFTFEIFSAPTPTSFIGNRSPDKVTSVSGTFTSPGWTTSTLNWTPTVSGDYWIALVVPSNRTAPFLDAPLETSGTTGTVPALAFASASSVNSAFEPETTSYIGLQVSEATPVPLPDAAACLLGSGLLGLGVTARRRRDAATK